MRFGSPGMLWWYAAFPLVLAFLIWSYQRRKRDLERFASAALVPKLTPTVSRARQINKAIVFFLFGALAVFALARPRFGVKMELVERKGVDVIVALDISNSMLARDITPSRIDRAKHEIGKFIDLLKGDRVGLVIFAGESYVQCPLTLDYGAARLFLDAVKTDWIPVQGTDLGGAIRLASDAFKSRSRKYKVLIILSDGEELEGDGVEAARAAARQGVRIYTIGIGSLNGVPIPVNRGSNVVYKKDKGGNLVMTRLNPVILEKIALEGNGAYFQAGTNLDFTAIYAEISAMEKRDLGMNRMTMYKEQYQMFLLGALLFLVLEFVLPEGARRKKVWRGRFES